MEKKIDYGEGVQLTREEVHELFDKTAWFSRPWQWVVLFFWEYFNKKKFKRFIIELHKGCHFKAAFERARDWYKKDFWDDEDG